MMAQSSADASQCVNDDGTVYKLRAAQRGLEPVLVIDMFQDNHELALQNAHGALNWEARTVATMLDLLAFLVTKVAFQQGALSTTLISVPCQIKPGDTRRIAEDLLQGSLLRYKARDNGTQEHTEVAMYGRTRAEVTLPFRYPNGGEYSVNVQGWSPSPSEDRIIYILPRPVPPDQTFTPVEQEWIQWCVRG